MYTFLFILNPKEFFQSEQMKENATLNAFLCIDKFLVLKRGNEWHLVAQFLCSHITNNRIHINSLKRDHCNCKSTSIRRKIFKENTIFSNISIFVYPAGIHFRQLIFHKVVKLYVFFFLSLGFFYKAVIMQSKLWFI